MLSTPLTRGRETVFSAFGRFLIIGGFTTSIQYGILFALTEFGGIRPLAASSVGFAASAATNYTLNRRFTFRSDVEYFAGLQKFAIIAGTGLLLNGFVMAAGIELAKMNYLVSQVLATGIVLLWNFQANRIWTFPITLADPAE